MFSDLVSQNRELLFLNGFATFALKKVQVKVRQLPFEPPSRKDTQALNSLVNAYLFRDFSQQCQGNAINQTVLQRLKSPGYRAEFIPRASNNLFDILRQQSQLKNISSSDFHIALDTETRQLAVYLANHSPFIHEVVWFGQFEDLQKLDSDSFLALLCATMIHQQCLDKNSTAAEIQLFYQGVCSGYMNLQLARHHHLNPLHNFLTPLIHHVSLLNIYRELGKHPQLPKAESLLTEIDTINLKLSYWISRDWGLPDEISGILKERFFINENPSLACQLMEKSEHAYLAIHLYQQGLLSRKQAESFLQAMQLQDFGFLEHSGTSH